MTEGNAVSGGAVSGSAVENEKTVGTEDWNQYIFSNDSHLYYVEWEEDAGVGIIVEYDRKARTERKILKNDLDAILYVDNNWVYYSTCVVTEDDDRLEDEIQTKIYRASVEAGVLRDGKEELLFTEEDALASCQLCGGGRYIAYVTANAGLYKKYDLKEKRFIGSFDPKEYEYSTVFGTAGEQIVLELGDALACQDISGEKVVLISRDAECYEPLIAMSDSDVFYVEGGCDSDEIWCYHLADRSQKKLGAKRQIEEILRREGFLSETKGKKYSCYVDHLLATGDRLYIQVDLSWEENGVTYRNKVMCSAKSGEDEKEGSSGLRYEEELTTCLANPKENQNVFEKYYYRGTSEKALFLSRGSVIAASGQQLYFCLYDPEKNKNKLACFDLGLGRVKFLTKKDEESIRLLAQGILPFRNWDGPEYFRPSGLHADMPNNDPTHTLW